MAGHVIFIKFCWWDCCADCGETGENSTEIMVFSGPVFRATPGCLVNKRSTQKVDCAMNICLPANSTSSLLRLSAASLTLLLGSLSASTTMAETDVVCMDSNLGEFCMCMFPDAAPGSVANFLKYVNDGDYDNTFIHRSVSDFVIQGGGYSFVPSQRTAVEVPKDAPVINEFRRANTTGTIALAKMGGNPNSGTSEWFINLGNNTSLDNRDNNGGYTVFGKVVLDGMTVVDEIARLPPTDISGVLGDAFTEVPLVNTDGSGSGANLSADDFVTLNRVYATTRDLSGTPDEVDCYPALTNYSANQFTIPVRVDGTLYRMTFVLTGTPPNYVFEVDDKVIVLLNDVGQTAASYANKVLRIPSAKVGNKILLDLEFLMTNRTNLEFTLQSYSKL